MTGTQIGLMLLDCKSWIEATSFQRGAFIVEMKNYQYGHDTLTQAWAWFLKGWNASD